MMLLICFLTISTILIITIPVTTMLFATLPGSSAAPFECGFEPAGPSVVPFCPKFWLVVILFLLFDVEVALLLPMGDSLSMGFVFLIALVMGTGLELGVGSLDWVA